VTDSNFVDNEAYWTQQIGGAIFGSEGGAVYSASNNHVTLNNCDFTGSVGGAVYCDSGSDLDVDDCLFENNSETHFGGAVFFGSSCTVNIDDCSFIDNWAYDDGGALKCSSNVSVQRCRFDRNEAGSYGGAVDLYRSGSHLVADFNDCKFTGNLATYGGGFSAGTAEGVFTDCYFVGNVAEIGGGLDFAYGEVFVTDSVIVDNQATVNSGGGLNCVSSDATVSNCIIQANVADGPVANGGGISFLGSALHDVSNCLIVGNSATVNGGGIFCDGVTPNIHNCTFSTNTAGGFGGAIFSNWDSAPQIINSIFHNCNSHAIHEEDVGGDALAEHCLFYDNPSGDYYDSGTGITYSGGSGPIGIGNIPGGQSNLYGDPLFVTGPLGGYYLSQVAAGQGVNSPAYNSGWGDVIALGLDTLTTRIDNFGDNNPVDRGYHYKDGSGLPMFSLTVTVVGGHGTVEPSSGTYVSGSVVALTAIPELGNNAATWSGGTVNDASSALTNSVFMDSDKHITVQFEQARTLIVRVGGGSGYYSDIGTAINDARDGDTIVVHPGTYRPLEPGYEVYKSVLITSLNPEEPECVADTIIDGSGYASPAFFVRRGTDENTVINGFTFANSRWRIAPPARGGDRDAGHPNGYDGGGADAGMIYVYSGAKATFKNCVIRDNFVQGQDAGNGVDATPTEHAGRGGWGGWGRGGGVYIEPYSDITFINCQIVDNTAWGANGGNGGQPSSTASPNYGGNWSTSGAPGNPAIYYDPLSLAMTFVTDGHLYEYFEWDYWMFYPYYDSFTTEGYAGDYRRYSGYGGGVYCDIGSTVTFIGCTISGNETYGGFSGIGGGGGDAHMPPQNPYVIPNYGAGVYCAKDSTITFTGCTITDNNAPPAQLIDPNDPTLGRELHIDPYIGQGGGVYAEDTAMISFTDCIFSDNRATAGAGIHWANANPRFVNCEFISNAAYQGGGMFGEHGPATIIDCDFINNEAITDTNHSDANNIEEIQGAGGGLHLWATEADIIDCNISNNTAEASGGGIYLGGEYWPSLTNCLLVNNTAGRDGGAISSNWYSQATIANCTIVNNSVTGSGYQNNYGGGLFCSYGSNTHIIDSILWDNFATVGRQIAISTGDEYEPVAASVTVTYSDIQGGAADAFVGVDCTLNGYDPSDPNSITNLHGTPGDPGSEPSFIDGNYRFYLSQTVTGGANQTVDSPCVDSGSDHAHSVDMYKHTTRTDGVLDADTVDIGYHYVLDSNFIGDFDFDNDVDIDDYMRFLMHWLDSDCGFPDWCHDKDLNQDGIVNNQDYAIFATNYMGEPAEVSAPTPNPMTWAFAPSTAGATSINMIATTAVDNSGSSVEYYFQCVYRGGGGGTNSGWINTPYYEDTGLATGKKYGYRVKARDTSNYNETDWSFIGYAIAGVGIPMDSTPPTPNPMTWAVVTDPPIVSPNSITMTATTATDENVVVEYYFEEISNNLGADDSGWQSSPVYTDTGLAASTTYIYRVRARDVRGNTTGWSPDLIVTTLATGTVPDNMPPLPDPSQWQVWPTIDPTTGWHYMMAMTADDATTGGNNPVWYYFECVVGSGIDSGWQLSPIYTYYHTSPCYYWVRTCDSIPGSVPPAPNPANAGSWSVAGYTGT
jgi:parallel beta-helix repeat protein